MTEFKVGTKPFPTKNKPRGLGNRHVLAVLGFVGFSISYALRFNLSIAIVAMVNSSRVLPQNVNEIMFKVDVCPHLLQLHSQQQQEQQLRNNNNTISFSLPHLRIGELSRAQETISLQTQNISRLNEPSPEIEFTKHPEITSPPRYNTEEELDGEFNWSESEQGLIHGSFFWGYILTQIPGGWMGHRFGGKWPFGAGLLITGALALLTPVAARFGGLEWLIALRFLQGFGGGVTVPAMYGLLAKWVPPDERGKITAFVYAGMAFGSALSMLVSGYIIHYLGWPWVFYFSGGITIIWFGFWSYFVHSSPDQHPRISQEELKYITTAIQGNSDCHQSSSPKKPPWAKILKSLPFWAVIFGQTSETWGLYTIMTELPTYMKTVLHFDIKENSLMSAFPHLLTWAVSILITQIGDYFIEKRYLSTGTVRKACNTLGFWGSAAALIGVAYSGCDRTITVTLLAVAVAAMGGIYGGVLVNMIDIAPNYASVLMGISNSCASVPGFLAPWVAGLLIDKDPSLERWRLVFLITAAVSFVGNLIFLVFASGEEQSWNWDDEDSKSRKKSRETVDISSFNEAQFYALSGSSVATTEIPMNMVANSSFDDHHV